MVSGRAPFEAETPQALLAKQAADTVPGLRASDPAIPLFFERAVERALAKSPDERFQTASGFAEALTSEVVVARVGGRRWPRGVIGAAAAGVALVLAWVLSTVLGGPAYERLAVLPPTNLMNDPEQEYLVQGMHDALISELQRAGVVVIGRTSVLQYENTQKAAQEIATELRVDGLIESSVFRAGDSVEMEVRLVDGRTAQVVAEPITRGVQLRNVLALYRDLTRAIAAEIHAALTPQAEAHLASARPVNQQAYVAYLKGMFHWRRVSQTDQDLALEYFHQALLLDPTYAPAQAGIALVWWMRNDVEQANAAAQQALALDSALAEVQYAVAMIRLYLEWDWEGGEAAFRKAIEINPIYPDARAFYAGFYYMTGGAEEGRAQIERAVELDPLNPLFRAMNGYGLLLERRYAEAIDELKAAQRIEPSQPVAFNLADAYHFTGNYDEALAQLRRRFPGDRELDAALDRGYEVGGYRAALLRYAETLVSRRDTAERFPSVMISEIYAWARDKERTLEMLEIAYQDHNYNLPGTLPAPEFDLVRDDPRFQDLCRRMNLPVGLEGN